MERLTTYENGLAKVKTNSPLVFQARLYRACLNRLAEMEDILGDDYDLDRLCKLSQADQTIGREIFLPNDGVRGTVEGFRVWKDSSITFFLVDGRHRYSMSSDLVYKFLVGRDRE